jgi:glyceraldehyde 3-phosphate dehydrogenase
MTKIAINGFGRIGRAAFKIAIEKTDAQVVAINDLTDAPTLAHLLKYDTAYGPYRRGVSSSEKSVTVDATEYPVYSEPDPEKLPWSDLGVDVVLECTGRFVNGESAGAHIRAGAKKVILSAPAKSAEEIPTVILGVNPDKALGNDIVSNASCTTNCIGAITKIINDRFGIDKAMMTTVHSYTADQNIQDAPHRDLRRARAAAQNIVPTTTGAAIATTEAIPDLAGRFDGLAIRVPTIVVSLSDLTYLLKRDVTVDEVNGVLSEAAGQEEYRGIIRTTYDPIVSSDVIGDPYSAVADLSLTKVVGGNMLKIIAWYDNEWGYSQRLVELALHVGKGLR